ncbi:MAG: Rrf2 family transcriptional regulator [bacterium]
MKISTRARYALRFMIDIALNRDGDRPLQLKDIARRQGISQRYLGQITTSLKNKFLIRGVAGKSGGFVLSKPPEEISIGSIIEAAIGPINVVDCVEDKDACMKAGYCECRPIYMLINRRICDALNEFTLADITGRHLIPVDIDEMIDSKTTGSSKDLCSSDFR